MNTGVVGPNGCGKSNLVEASPAPERSWSRNGRSAGRSSTHIRLDLIETAREFGRGLHIVGKRVTPVYGRDDNKIGTVQRVMLDKISGKVAYAVVSFGGFLGIGEDYFPMPWASLKYDTALGGYRVGITEDQLNNAPRFNRSTDWDWSDRARDRTVYDYYKTPLWY
jgi:hypothetical protein